MSDSAPDRRAQAQPGSQPCPARAQPATEPVTVPPGPDSKALAVPLAVTDRLARVTSPDSGPCHCVLLEVATSLSLSCRGPESQPPGLARDRHSDPPAGNRRNGV
jgi:hypothetical protein